MTTNELLELRTELDEASMTASYTLNEYCKPYRIANGLITDECRNTDRYMELSAAYVRDFNQLRAFNSLHSKNKEYQKARLAEIRAHRFRNATV